MLTEEQLQDALNVTAETIRRLTDFVAMLSQCIIAQDKRLQEVERLLSSSRKEDR